MNEKYFARESQLYSIDEAVDTLMVAMHILWDCGEEPLVTPEAVASMISLAYGVIVDTVDAIRGQQDAKEAQP